MKKITSFKDIKVESTINVWGFATGMLGICIPLTSISQTGIILPLAAIAGATIATVAIWSNENPKITTLSDNFQQIEQRLRTLETIASDGDLGTFVQAKGAKSLNHSGDG